ncbi:MAG: hypothetical protein LBJ08_08885 [Bifidobacteriaceae bacterium]|nr:hypothetical protein [Bifidobacteriaceae bacterium]
MSGVTCVGLAARSIAWACAAILGVLAPAADLSAVAEGPKAAEAVSPPTATPNPGDQLAAYWDGPTLSVDWHGDTRAVASGSFVGDRVAVPGDRVHRTLKVRNQGPSDATLSVAIANPAAMGDDGLAFAGLIALQWGIGSATGSAPFADVVGRSKVALGSVKVKRCASVPVSLGYSYPFDATAGQAAADGSAALTFDVALTLRGEPDPAQSSAPPCDPVPSKKPARTPKDDVDGEDGFHSGTLARTGATLIAPLGAVLGLVLGAILVRRRRRTDRDGTPAIESKQI